MKRLVMIAVITGLHCGCSAMSFSAPMPDFDTCYTMQAELEYGDHEAVADVTRNGEGSWVFAFTEPAELMGVTITLENDDITASLGELSLTTEQSTEWSSAPATIAESIDALSDISAESVTENDGVLTLTTDIDGKPCQMTADKATGRLISLKYPHGGIAAYFSGQESFIPDIAASETEEQVGLVIE